MQKDIDKERGITILLGISVIRFAKIPNKKAGKSSAMSMKILRAAILADLIRQDFYPNFDTIIARIYRERIKNMDARKKQFGEESDVENAKRTDVKKRTVELLKNIFWGAIYALCGYFMGGAVLPFGALPFGVALLSASNRRVFYIYAGLCLSAWYSPQRVLLIGVYSALILTRLLVRALIDPPWGKSDGEKTIAEIYPKLFSEHIALRMSTSAVGAFAIGIYRITSGGFMYYDLYGTIISVVSAPIAVLLFSGFFVGDTKKYRQLAGLLALSSAVIFSFGDLKFYGVSLAVFGAMFMTLYLTRKGGTVMGVLSGALIGLVLSLDRVPLFALVALVAGIIFSMSPAFAISASLSVGVAWGVYTDGLGVLNGTLSGIVTAALIYGVADKLFLKDEIAKTKEYESDEGETAESGVSDSVAKVRLLDSAAFLDRARLEDARMQIEGTRESFASMSDALYTISQRIQSPNASDLHRICDNAFDSSCTSCPNKPECWGDRYRESNDALGRISAALHRKGTVGVEDCDGILLNNCSRLSDILSEINHNAYLHTKQILESDRTELFALDYGALADFISGSLSLPEGEYKTDSDLASKISKAISTLDIDYVGVIVWGERQRKIEIFANDRSALVENADKIEALVAEVCPFGIGDRKISEDKALLRLFETAAISVVTAERNMSAEHEDKYCGDTSGIFRTRAHRIYSFISDGMGSGREAALASGICGLFLRKFLSTGCSCESTLKLLNGFLKNRGSTSLYECSATVDLMELDLITKKATFYKSGASPTYVFRNGGLFKIRSHTVPIGIIKDIDVKKIDFTVDVGDLFVMISDGVIDGKEECPWLFDLLRGQGASASPERLADLIMKYAKAEGATDDLSVIVIKIA